MTTTDLPQPSETPGAERAAAFLQELLLSDAPLAEFLATGKVIGSTGAWTDPSYALAPVLRWTPDLGWLSWDGKVWVKVPEPYAVDRVREKLKRMFLERMSAADANATVNAAFKPLLSKSKAANVTYFLKGLVSMDSAAFDADADLINVQNGVIDLQTGKLRPHRPGYLMTKIAAVNWVPDASHKDWTTALAALPEDTREYMQVRYGQSITGHPVDDDVLIVQAGGGQNGKSTIMEGIAKSLGGYGVVVPEKVLLASPGEHPTELMTLRGARFALIEETPEGHRLPTKRLKDLVGTPVMTARAMRQDFVSWDTSHTLFVDTNYVPQVAETDHGTWRRLQLVNFPYKFVHPSEPLMAPNERHGVPGLRERIRDNTSDQLEAVLAWLVEGALTWYEQGRAQSAVPLTIQADTQSWRSEADLILAYAQERLSFDPDYSVPTKELYEDFSDWLRDAGRQVWNDQTWASRFGSHDLTVRNRVEKRRVNLTGAVQLSRRFSSKFNSDLGSKVSIWSGVRFNS